MTETKGNPPGEPPQDLESQAHNRRTALMGVWAAELLGLIGHAAHDYAKDLTHRHRNSGEDGMLRKLVKDLEGKATAHEIHEKMKHLLHEAREQLRREKK